MMRSTLCRSLCAVALAALPSLAAGAAGEGSSAREAILDAPVLFDLGTGKGADASPAPSGGGTAPKESGGAAPAERGDASPGGAPVPLAEGLGELVHDGPATPEQLSLLLPIVGKLAEGATARVRYHDGARWLDAHPLVRVRPEFALKGSNAQSAFAGVVTGLAPGRGYRVEVSVSDGRDSLTRTLEASTRALPGRAGAATKTVAPGDGTEKVQALLDRAEPGDVIVFRNGVHEVDNLRLRASGSDAKPIVVRGESRAGTRIVDRSGRVLHLVNASNLVIEDLTLEGSGSDSGGKATSEGIRVWDEYTARRVTIRNVTITGVDKGIVGGGEMEQFLVYDNTLEGNNAFDKATLESKASWNDDGIRVPGRGHAVFNNTLSGFGDSLAMSRGPDNVGVHFFRNRILFTCDDAFEGDYGTRNISFYDNRVQNSMTLASFDPVYGGPAFVFRNVAINTGRQPYKLNNTNTGMFFYNNTVVRIPGHRSGANWGWSQSDNGKLRNWGYRNNILIFAGRNLLAMEAGGQSPIDFTHNAWHPDGKVWWSSSGGSFSSMSGARVRLPATAPVFGGSDRRHDHDLIAERNPFATEIRFGASYDVPVKTLYEPALAPASRLRNAGVAIPGVTDGFSGAKPDIGAVISGRATPEVGDRSTGNGRQRAAAR